MDFIYRPSGHIKAFSNYLVKKGTKKKTQNKPDTQYTTAKMIAARALAQARMPIYRSFQTSARRANATAPRSADWSNIVKTRAKSALM